jgi:hypothetical protein
VPISALDDPGYISDTGAYCDADVHEPEIAGGAVRSASAPRVSAALPALLGPNRARRVGVDGERVAPAFLPEAHGGFRLGAASATAVAGPSAGDAMIFGSNRDTSLRPIGPSAVAAELRRGVLRYRGAFSGRDLIVRPAALGAQLAIVEPASGRYRFHVGHRPDAALARLPNGVVAVLTSEQARRLPRGALSLRGLPASDGRRALSDPARQLAMADAAVSDVARLTGRRPALVLVPSGGARLDVEGDAVALTNTDRSSGPVVVHAVAPTDLVDDQDATEPSAGCFPAGPEEPEGVSARSNVFRFPGVKCLGRANKALGVGGGGIEVRGQTVCYDKKSRSLSAKACLATKSFGVSFLSSYSDWRCPSLDNVAFGTIVGQWNVFPCKPGNHKYKTHLWSKVNGVQTNGYQSGRLHIKNCG